MLCDLCERMSLCFLFIFLFPFGLSEISRLLKINIDWFIIARERARYISPVLKRSETAVYLYKIIT